MAVRVVPTNYDEKTANSFAYGMLSRGIPLNAHPGSIIPFGAREDGVLYDYAQDALYRVYAQDVGEMASACVYGMDAALQSRLTVCRDEKGYAVDYQGDKPCEIVLIDECGQIALRLEGAKACRVPPRRRSGYKTIYNSPAVA